MAKETRNKNVVWKRAGAIVAGFLTGAVLSLGTDQVLHKTGIYPPWGQTMSDSLGVLATAYRIIFNVLGCFVAARLAPFKPMWHALFIGVAGLALGTIAAVGTWNANPPLGPHWYAVVVALMSVPCAWLGGKLYLMVRK